MSEPLISVIVPVYRVEKYLGKCVNSLIEQTYGNIEILLVDDGSDDSCPKICDRFALSNKKIRCYHKQNGGLSDARNFGVLNATGEYIIFVDSDDYVDRDFVLTLYESLCNNKSDMAVTGCIIEQEDGEVIKHYGDKHARCFYVEQAFIEMCYGKNLPIFAWGKIYRRSSLLKHPYPLGKLHEDVGTTYLLISDCDAVSTTGCFHYHYIQRNNSILHNEFKPELCYALEASQNIITFASDRFPNALGAAVARLSIEANSILHRAVKNKEYQDVRKRVMCELSGKWKKIILDRDIPLKIRMQLFLCRMSGRLYKQIYCLIVR